jgi:A/G-specific adenine glycosylase
MEVSTKRFPNRKLLDWYDRSKRDLPWRETSDPYRIWLSEIILQQTRVDQGLPYYNRFVQQFPTVAELALASEDDVLKLWEGLGYYSRARNLHETAKHIHFDLGGIFPSTYESILKLKGVGSYTAAAIGSIAFQLPVAAVDGNVMRVVSRYFGISESIDEGPTKTKLANLAQEILAVSDPSAHNQAMMELGATCCTPSSPNCPHCPIAAGCAANTGGLQSLIPVRTRKTKIRHRFFYYLIPLLNNTTVLNRRPEGDIWHGLYEFPMVEFSEKWSVEDAVAVFELGNGSTVLRVSEEFKHVLSHQRICATFIVARVASLKDFGGNEVTITELDSFAMPRLITRYLEQHPFANDVEV